MAAARVRVAARGEEEGEEEHVVAEVLFSLQGGPGKRGGGRGGQGDTAASGGSVSPVATGGRDDRWVPLSGISPFSIFQKFQQALGI